MKKVLLIHGYGGIPNGGWRPWLMRELATSDIGTFCMALGMPSPNKPKAEEWVAEIARQVIENPKDKFILVGHSLGVTAIMRFLQDHKPKNIIGCVFVSGPYKNDKKDLKDFFSESWNFKDIKKFARKIVVIHGEDDRSVKFEQAEFLASNLECELVKVKKGGHLNIESGFDKLPQALKAIQEILK
jgi:predicted alpha/beta hydrolase family esterase